MKLNQLKQGKFKDYSFNDLEYGISIFNKDIQNIKNAIKVINRVSSKLHGIKRYKHYKASVLEPYMEEIKELEALIEKTNEEIAERLLTGNDDGITERELLNHTT